MRGLIFAAFAFMAPIFAHAQTSLHTISTVPAQPRAGEAFQIKVTGSWPNTCPLQALPVVVDGANIDVAVRQGDVICGDAITPYVMIFDATSVGGPGFPAAIDYRVRFSVRDAAGNPTLLGFHVVDVLSSGARAIQPESGFWSPDTAGEFLTSGSGIGFMIESQNSTVAVTTNAYQMNGQPAWYLTTGVLTGSVLHGDLLRSLGGQPLWGTYRGPQSVTPAGSVSIEFLSNAQAVAWYSRPSGEGLIDPLELMPISIRRMNFALASEGRALAGTWAVTPVSALSSLDISLLRLSYSAERSNATEAVLLDTVKGFELRCALDTARPDGPPRSCILSSGGAEIGRFDNNALTRLGGKRGGESIALVRVAN